MTLLMLSGSPTQVLKSRIRVNLRWVFAWAVVANPSNKRHAVRNELVLIRVVLSAQAFYSLAYLAAHPSEANG